MSAMTVLSRVRPLLVRQERLVSRPLYAPPGGWARPMDERIPQIWPPMGNLDLASIPDLETLFEALLMAGNLSTIER
jgi:hypothetical protein